LELEQVSGTESVVEDPDGAALYFDRSNCRPIGTLKRLKLKGTIAASLNTT